MKSLEKIKEQTQTSEPETKERQLPVGIGGAELKKDRETLPAIEVANEVAWVNNKMNSPFDLKVGRQSRLGMFLTPNPQEGENIFNLEVSESHTRSGILGRVIFNDKEGRLYRDIDLKGMGYITSGPDVDGKGYKREVGQVLGSYGKISGEQSQFSYFLGTTGIANQELIRRDIDFSEKFLKAGIRTHRVIAVIDLTEIIDEDGKKISIAAAKEKDILSKEDEPVIEVRAFGVRSRLFDLMNHSKNIASDGTLPPKARKILDDAKSFVTQEQNINLANFTDDAYFKWLADTIAINIARMCHHGWVSGYLTVHNITLDARLVDLDSVIVFREDRDEEGVNGMRKSYENDFDYAREELTAFFSTLAPEKDNTKYGKSFNAAYKTELARLKLEKKPHKPKNK
ncbi:MAG: hypothetical protein Q7S43_01330 [bacterium]|nr:hypothetical protein [bacterium]